VTEVHLAVGVSVLASNLIAGAWGGICWLARRPSVRFWLLLRVAQLTVVVQVLLGGLLVLNGHEATDGLHYVYGLLPLVVSFLAEAVRVGAAGQELGEVEFDRLPEDRQRALALAILRREMGIMATSALVIFGLALRAALTTPSF
jgi:hypothetical protein